MGRGFTLLILRGEEIWGFDYDAETGEWSNQTVVVDTSHIETSPDGMVMDAEGKVWVAFCHGGCVARFDVETGEELQRIGLPCVETTACTWGGENLDELYVTTGVHKSIVEEDAGRLFVVKGLGVRGNAGEWVWGVSSGLLGKGGDLRGLEKPNVQKLKNQNWVFEVMR